MNVMWMKEPRGIDAHGFGDLELSLGLERVESIGFDGPYVRATLQEDENAPRCAACVRAAVRMARR